MSISGHRLNFVALVCSLVCIFAGCGSQSTLTPVFETSEVLPRPDRVIVEEFAVTMDDLAADAVGAIVVKQTAEDIRVGRAFAKALTDQLVAELRRREIDAQRASDAAPPGDNTASIKGRFVRARRASDMMPVGFDSTSGEVRTRIWILQGAQLRSRVVSEADTATKVNLTSNPGAGLDEAISSGARQTAVEVADRFFDYYKRRGWIK